MLSLPCESPCTTDSIWRTTYRTYGGTTKPLECKSCHSAVDKHTCRCQTMARSSIALPTCTTAMHAHRYRQHLRRLPYSRKLSREKTFTNPWNIRFRGENFRGFTTDWIYTKWATPIFVEKTFTNGSRCAKFVKVLRYTVSACLHCLTLPRSRWWCMLLILFPMVQCTTCCARRSCSHNQMECRPRKGTRRMQTCTQQKPKGHEQTSKPYI